MQKKYISKSVYNVAAALLLVLFLMPEFCESGQDKGETSPRIVMLGDSVLGECRDETSVSAQVSALLGEEVFNGALGGTTMSYIATNNSPASVNDCMSMASLSRSIVSDDFGPQQAARIRESMTDYFEDTINEMEQIDFASVDILLIAHGVNDYHAGIPIANEENPYDTYTYTGTIRSAVELLRQRYPDMRIILMTPTYTWYPYYATPRLTCEEYNLGGGVLEEYVNAEIELAEAMGVEVIDNYHELYPHEAWSDWELCTNDGLHPNEWGRQLIAQKIADYLEKH